MNKKVEKAALISQTTSLINEIKDLDLANYSYFNFNSDNLLKYEDLLINNLIFILDEFLQEIKVKIKKESKSKKNLYQSLSENVQNLKKIIHELEGLKVKKINKSEDQKKFDEIKKKDEKYLNNDFEQNEKMLWVCLFLSKFTANSVEKVIEMIKYRIETTENEILSQINILKDSMDNLNKSLGFNNEIIEFLSKKVVKYEKKLEAIKKIIVEEEKEKQNLEKQKKKFI